MEERKQNKPYLDEARNRNACMGAHGENEGANAATFDEPCTPTLAALQCVAVLLPQVGDHRLKNVVVCFLRVKGFGNPI